MQAISGDVIWAILATFAAILIPKLSGFFPQVPTGFRKYFQNQAYRYVKRDSLFLSPSDSVPYAIIQRCAQKPKNETRMRLQLRGHFPHKDVSRRRPRRLFSVEVETLKREAAESTTIRGRSQRGCFADCYHSTPHILSFTHSLKTVCGSSGTEQELGDPL